jgi:hypothetical protein
VARGISVVAKREDGVRALGKGNGWNGASKHR